MAVSRDATLSLVLRGRHPDPRPRHRADRAARACRSSAPCRRSWTGSTWCCARTSPASASSARSTAPSTRRRRFDDGQRRPDRDGDQRQPHHGLADADPDAGDELHDHRDHLVRRPAHRQRRHAGRLADRVPAVRHADHVLAAHGLDAVRHGAARRRRRRSRINEVLDTGAGDHRPSAGRRRRPASAGCVEFRNVTFSYPGAEQPALCDISFTARPGEVTAIIGGTGAGKSTLVNLIPRFYDVDSGSILVDGVDVREMSQETLRAQASASCRSRRCCSPAPSPTISATARRTRPTTELRHAADVAQATDFITAMPEGFDVADRAGRHERLRRPEAAPGHRARPGPPAEIYIFDDSFSALDFKTDARLRARAEPRDDATRR